MAECPQTQHDVNFAGGKQQQIVFQELQSAVVENGPRHARGKHIERRIRPVREHLVDDKLKEERCQQGNDGDDGDGQRNLGKDPLVPQKFGQKPGQPERLIRVVDGMAAFEQQRRTGKGGLKGRAIQKAQARRGRGVPRSGKKRLNACFAVVRLLNIAENGAAARARCGQHRKNVVKRQRPLP